MFEKSLPEGDPPRILPIMNQYMATDSCWSGEIVVRQERLITEGISYGSRSVRTETP
jgi:hypothetical protein